MKPIVTKTQILQIHDWMLGLGLTDKQLKLYALIYGYSQDGMSRMRGTAISIARWLGCSRKHVRVLLRELEDQGYIAHEVVRHMNETFSLFWVLDPDNHQRKETTGRRRWFGSNLQVPTGSNLQVPTDRDSNIYPQDSNINKNTRGKNNGARRARKPAPEDTPDLFAPDPKTKRFAPPSVEEVAAYCQERGNSVDPQRFVDFYTSNGWKVGKSAMKDWRAAVRTWEARDLETPRRQQPARREYESPEAHNLRILRELQERDGMLNSIVDEQ